MFAHGRVGIRKNDPLLAEFFFERAVNDFTFELRLDAGQKLFFCLRDSQLVKRFFDLVGDFIPRVALAVGRFQIVVDILKTPLHN